MTTPCGTRDGGSPSLQTGAPVTYCHRLLSGPPGPSSLHRGRTVSHHQEPPSTGLGSFCSHTYAHTHINHTLSRLFERTYVNIYVDTYTLTRHRITQSFFGPIPTPFYTPLRVSIFFLKEKKKTRVPRCASFALQVSIPTTATSYRNGRCHNGSQALHNGNC